MRFRPPHPRQGVGLDLTPVIDCVFNLLIFFALSFNFGQTEGIPVRLPASGAGTATEAKSEVAIAVTRQGDVFIDGRPVSLAALAMAVRGLGLQAPLARAVIRADEATSHGTVVAVMDAVRSAGIGRIVVATRPPSSRP